MTITGFKVVNSENEPIHAFPFGNNVAFNCEGCGHPILCIAIENQLGCRANKNPAQCPECSQGYYMDVDEAKKAITIHCTKDKWNKGDMPCRFCNASDRGA